MFLPDPGDPEVAVIRSAEFVSLLFSSIAWSPLVEQRHRDGASALAEGIGPHPALQLIGAGVVDRRIEAPVKSPAHDLHLTVGPEHDARIGLPHHGRRQLCRRVADLSGMPDGPALRDDAVGIAHGSNLAMEWPQSNGKRGSNGEMGVES